MEERSRRRKQEYERMEQDGEVYLDHAGATLYPRSVVEEYACALTRSLYGNPHAQASPSAVQSRAVVDRVRRQVLEHFDALEGDEYAVIWTANATAALHLVADAFPWQGAKYPRSLLSWFTNWFRSLCTRVGETFLPRRFLPGKPAHLFLLKQNHTSVYGMRAVALRHGARCEILGENDVVPQLTTSSTLPSLLVYPAQCNFSGRRFPLDWIHAIHRRPRSYVCLDAASYCTTSTLSLRQVPADFVCVSFYKLFGFPTNVGALLVRKDVEPMLQKHYFGGGTVSALTVQEPWQAYRRNISEKWEDGTLPFLELVALDIAFRRWQELHGTWAEIHQRVSSLVQYAHARLSALRHGRDTPLVHFYGVDDLEQHGSILNLNIRNADGSFVSAAKVNQLASLVGIHLRTGGLCNPGALQAYLDVSDRDVRELYEEDETVCWNDRDLVRGKPMGSIRISFGAMSMRTDVDRFVEFLETFFLGQSKTLEQVPIPLADSLDVLQLHRILLYPIKSCHAFEPPSNEWLLTRNGLEWDREWSLVSCETGRAMQQKQYPSMALIRPSIDVHRRILRVFAPGQPELVIPLDQHPDKAIEARICGVKLTAYSYEDSRISRWFSTFLQVPCTLVRRPPTTISDDAASFSNESPVLLVCEASTARVQQEMCARNRNQFEPASSLWHRNGNLPVESFRPNLIIRGGHAFQEDAWDVLRLDSNVQLKILGGCRRCHMVCINQETAEKNPEPFLTLALLRKKKGQILFGVHASLETIKSSCRIRCGDSIMAQVRSHHEIEE